MRELSSDKLQKLMETAEWLFLNNGRRIDEITTALGISKKELLEMLQTVSLCGIPPYDPSSLINAYIEDDRVFIEHVWGLFSRPTRFSRGEAVSLFLVGRALAGSVKPDSALESALCKIKAALKSDIAEAVDKSSSQIQFDAQFGNDGEILRELKRNCGKSKVAIQYFSAGRRTLSERLIHPYGLIYYISHWYCAGYCEMRGDVRLFRVDRIKTAAPTKEIFAVPGAFDLENFKKTRMFKLIDRPLKVVLELPGAMVEIAKEMWHGKIKITKEGSIVATFRVDDFDNVIGFILGLGNCVKVLDPPELKNRVQAKAQELASRYNIV